MSLLIEILKDHLTETVAIVSSITGAFGACLAYLQIRATGRTVMHDLYFRLRERYTQPDVNDALVRLHFFKETHGVNFADIWYDRFKSKDVEATQINADRRLISSFFNDLVRAYEIRALSLPLAAALASVSGLDVFLIACMPLNQRYYGATSGDEVVRTLKFLKRKSRPAFLR